MEKNTIRKKYIDTITPWIGRDMIKVLTGMRRSGKSMILLQLHDIIRRDFSVPEADIIFIDKERIEWDHIRNYEDLYTIAKDKKVIFVDEIQTIVEWERAILSLQSEGKDIYITGSNSTLLASGLATNLRGRSIEFRIYPLDYREFIEFEQTEDEAKTFEKYIHYGGLPYIHKLPSEKSIIEEYTKNILSTIVLRDIIERYTIRNGWLFHLLLQYIAREIGGIFASQSITNFLKSQRITVSPMTILDYLSYLQDAYVIVRCPRYDIRGKKLFEIRQKYFFTDIGIRNSIVWGYRKSDISWILENIVAINLLSNGWTLSVGEIAETEVDLIAEKNGKRIYIQIAYLMESTTTQERELKPLKLIQDNWEKYIISMDAVTPESIDGVQWMSVRDFLLLVV